jgi:hypothetical protein
MTIGKTSVNKMSLDKIVHFRLTQKYYKVEESTLKNVNYGRAYNGIIQF